LDALRFSNRICRYFLNDAKYDGIRMALSYFPHDIDMQHSIIEQEQSTNDLREFKAFGTFIAALEAIQRWSELHQKQVGEDQTYLPVVTKACYDVFDYLQGWLVDSANESQLSSDDDINRQAELSILRHKYIPMLACNLFRIFDLAKEYQQTMRLLIFLSNSRQQQQQQLYSLFSKDALASVLSLIEHAAERCLDRQSGDDTTNYFL